jgi:phage terminase large subunit-like protein
MKNFIAHTPFETTHKGAERLSATFEKLSKMSRKIKLKTIRKCQMWSRRQKAKRAEAQMWDFAKKDPRFMAEIQAAIARNS